MPQCEINLLAVCEVWNRHQARKERAEGPKLSSLAAPQGSGCLGWEAEDQWSKNRVELTMVAEHEESLL